MHLMSFFAFRSSTSIRAVDEHADHTVWLKLSRWKRPLALYTPTSLGYEPKVLGVFRSPPTAAERAEWLLAAMATLQRRRRQGSREPAAAAEAPEPRRAPREDRRRPPPEETADQKLDRLLKEQRAARASSLPAEDDLAVRRLAMHPTAEGNESQGRRREGSLAPQPGHHGGHHDASAGQLAGAGGLMSALHDPRANALGLGGLQEAARQSFELLLRDF